MENVILSYKGRFLYYIILRSTNEKFIKINTCSFVLCYVPVLFH